MFPNDPMAIQKFLAAMVKRKPLRTKMKKFSLLDWLLCSIAENTIGFPIFSRYKSYIEYYGYTTKDRRKLPLNKDQELKNGDRFMWITFIIILVTINYCFIIQS